MFNRIFNWFSGNVVSTGLGVGPTDSQTDRSTTTNPPDPINATENPNLISHPNLETEQGIHTVEHLPNSKASDLLAKETTNSNLTMEQNNAVNPSTADPKLVVTESDPKSSVPPECAQNQTPKSHPELVMEQGADITESLPSSKASDLTNEGATKPALINQAIDLNNGLEKINDPPKIESKPEKEAIHSKDSISSPISSVEIDTLEDITKIKETFSETLKESVSLETADQLTKPEDNIVQEERPKKTEEIPEATQKQIEEKLENTNSQNQESTDTNSQKNVESDISKKALELVVETSSFNEESEEKEIDINDLSKQIFEILEEGKNEEQNENQLKQRNDDLKDFIIQLIGIIKHKTELCFRLEKQNEALIQQAKSLKNVIAITKDLLGIRNMEVEHLHEDMKLLEDNINAERTRHDLLLQKLAESLKLNDSLKTEYHKQQGLFQSLREKYHEKIIILNKENQRLNNLVNGSNEESTTKENGEGGIQGSDTVSTETVEK